MLNWPNCTGELQPRVAFGLEEKPPQIQGHKVPGIGAIFPNYGWNKNICFLDTVTGVKTSNQDRPTNSEDQVQKPIGAWKVWRDRDTLIFLPNQSVPVEPSL